MPVNTAITLRKGSASQWSTTNPILASGEPGYDLTNNILKIGDGVSAWNSLNNHQHTTSNISGLNSTATELNYLQGVTPGTGIANKALVLDSVGSIQVPLLIQSYGVEASFLYAPDSNILNIASNSGSFNNSLKVNNIPVSVSGHSHTSSQISDFNTAVTSVSPEEVVEYLATTNFPPSGDSTLLYIATDASRAYRWTGSEYIEVGSSASYATNHSHSANDITNFNSSVSGLLPITSILAGNNVSVVASGTSYIISSSGTGGGSSIKLGTIMALS